MFRRNLVALAAFAGVAACGQSPSSSPSTQDQGTPVQPTALRDLAPDVSPADAAELSADNLTFAFNLYPGVATDEISNVFYSPYSASLALAMTYAGAAGETAQQIATALQFDLPPARLHPAFDALDLALESHAIHGVTVDIADSLWGDESLEFQPGFLDILSKNYGSGLRVTDFMHAPEPARSAINNWVSSETEQTIPDLLPDGSITSSTRFVLVNAIYFHATWLTQFNPSMTKPSPFTRLDGSVVQAPSMTNAAASCSTVFGQGYEAGELQYANEQTSMVIVLPAAGQFTAVESGLTGGFVSTLFSRLSKVTPSGTAVTLPKFSIKTATFSLSAELEKLGMTDAFRKGADFSAMLPGGNVFLTDVLQQAYIDVSEAGTKASAATAVIGGQDDGAVEAPPALVVDRPFLFVIRDIPTNTALFVGRVLDPTL